MERYNYYRAVKHDVLDYIHENLSSDDWQNNRDGLEEHLSEALHCKMAPCREQDFFDAYCGAHREKFGEVWELAKPNPCY